MKHDKPDRRVQRTRQALNNALIALLHEKRYDAITVQDILDRANVGRSTFYSHFYDKDDLLLSDVEGIFRQLTEPAGRAVHETSGVFSSLGLFQHVDEHRDLYKALVRSQKIDMVVDAAHAYLSNAVEQQVRHTLPLDQEPEVPVAAIAEYVAASFLALLRWWLDNDVPYAAEQMEQLFQQLVMPGVASVVHGQRGNQAEK